MSMRTMSQSLLDLCLQASQASQSGPADTSAEPMEEDTVQLGTASAVPALPTVKEEPQPGLHMLLQFLLGSVIPLACHNPVKHEPQ